MDKRYKDNSSQLSLTFSAEPKNPEKREVKVISMTKVVEERRQELRNEFRALSDGL